MSLKGNLWTVSSEGRGGLSQISTVFDSDKENPHRILYSSSIRNTLIKLLPPHLFLLGEGSDSLIDEFLELLPAFKWALWGEEGLQLSVYLLCRHRINGVRFFYDMISRWLMPGKRLNISSFFATDFKFFEHSDELFTVCEIVISLNNASELAQIRDQLPIIEGEIRMGLLSVYHANRILEIKGLSADEKTSLIQERIASLLEKRPKDFDHAIFAQMQHFLVMCSEEFKAIREYRHMSRIIYVFYLFRKILKGEIEKNPLHRFVHVKVSLAYLHHAFGIKKILGVFAALNFQGDHELFEERHLAGVIHSQFPHLAVVEDSFFFRTSKEERIQLLYLEVEKGDGTHFLLSEIKSFQNRLPGEIRSGIEKLARPLFMPRNEEDVMRNILILSHQLQSSGDLPQVIINFESQVESELFFTVIWLRVLKPLDSRQCTEKKNGAFLHPSPTNSAIDSCSTLKSMYCESIAEGLGEGCKNPQIPLFGTLPSIPSLFEKSDCTLKFLPDRIKQVGLLRKKYPKEATVFRLVCLAQHFLRPDHSVDLFKARQWIGQELQRVLGEFRDYNGGMISKQHEQFTALKGLFPKMDKNKELLLENFFHSIFPIEHRSVFNPCLLKNLFNLFCEAVHSNERKFYAENNEGSCYFLISCNEVSLGSRVVEEVKKFQIPSSQILTLSLEHLGIFYLGVLYAEESRRLRDDFMEHITDFVKLDF